MKIKRALLLMVCSLMAIVVKADYTITVGGSDLVLYAPSSTDSRKPDLYDVKWSITSGSTGSVTFISSTSNPTKVRAVSAGKVRVLCSARYYNKSRWTDPLYTGYSYENATYDITVLDNGGGGSGGGDDGGGGSGEGTDDVFTVSTSEGISMVFSVITNSQCRTGRGEYDSPCVSKSTSGTVTIPSYANGYTVVAVGISSFSNCTNVSKVVIPNTVTDIGNQAFYQCGMITLEMGNAVRTIENYGISNCPNLTKINLSSSLESIGNGAISSCSSLEELTLPEGLKKIGKGAFSGCPLKKITALMRTPITLSDDPVYPNIYKTAILYVPKGCKSLYQNANYWSNFTIKEIGEDDEVVPTAVSLPSSATVKVGSSITLTPTLTPSNAKTTLIWSSDDSNIATVSTSGVVKGIKAGSTYINVRTANGKTDYCKVTVEASSVEPTSITLPSSKTVKVGESFTMSYTLTPSNATTTLTWSSDDSSIATVTSSGLVKGIKDGSTKIRVSTANGKTDYCNVTVEDDSNYESLDIVEQNLATGTYHSLILKKDGTLWACGYNEYGQLGDGTTTDRHTPVQIMNEVANIAAGAVHSLILKKDGTLWACGQNSSGQLGDGTTTERHMPVQIMDNVANIAAGGWCSLILKKNGTLWACGANSDGQLGDGTTTNRNAPTQIMGDVADMAVGRYHSLILKKDGTLWACGENSFGQLGDGTTNDRHVPVQIMDDVLVNMAGDLHSLILKKDGTLWAFGKNLSGQLGDGTTTERHMPVQIMDDVENMAAGNDHSLILKKDGTLWACGDNEYGQLGDETTTDRRTPVRIMDDVANMAAGRKHSLILKKDGTLWACGDNEYGQLGDGTTTERHTPVKMQIVYDEDYTIEVTTSDKGYATFYSSKSAYSLPKGLSAQVVTEVSDGKLSYQTIADGYESGIIPRGVAVMLTNDSKRKEKFTLTAAESNVTYSGRNMLNGSDMPTTTTAERSNCLFYKLAYAQNSSDVFGWFWGARDGAAFQIEGHRAWLSVPKTAGVKAFVIEGDATGIADLQPTSSSGAIYDLQGRRIPQPTHKGVYVIDGRKVVIK